MNVTRIKAADLAANTGQIQGVPANPREWTGEDVRKLAKSIQETPELLEARPLIVTPVNGVYVVLGGNLRLTACKRLKMAEIPAVVIDAPADKLREIVIKDNGAFGAWDYDALANEWDTLPLSDWGVPAWDTGEDAAADQDVSGNETKRARLSVTIEIPAELAEDAAAIKTELQAVVDNWALGGKDIFT